MTMPGKQVEVTSTTSPATGVPLPVSHMLKTAAADAKTTNALLLILVLCISGYMPEQFQTLCGL